MICRDVNQLISRVAAGHDATGSESLAMVRHLASCGPCLEIVMGLQQAFPMTRAAVPFMKEHLGKMERAETYPE